MDVVADSIDAEVMRVDALPFAAAATLLSRYGLMLHRVDDGASIPGSYWGNPKPASSHTTSMCAATRPCTRCCTKPAT